METDGSHDVTVVAVFLVGVLQGLVLTSMYFNVCINDLEENKVITDKVCR